MAVSGSWRRFPTRDEGSDVSGGTVGPMDVGPAELLIVLVIALVLFGGKKLPELARSLGQARNEFEKGSRGETVEPASAEPAPTDAVTTTPVGDQA